MAMVRAALAGLLLGTLVDRWTSDLDASNPFLFALLMAVLIGPETVEAWRSWRHGRTNPPPG